MGQPDERAGETPHAFVVLKPDTEATAEEISAFIAEKVAVYKQLGAVTFIPEVPKSASGKILRRVLKEQVSA